MQAWQILIVLVFVAGMVLMFLSALRKRKNKNEKPLSAAEQAAQAEYEADLQKLELLRAELAASPNYLLQIKIAELEAKLGLNQPQGI